MDSPVGKSAGPTTVSSAGPDFASRAADTLETVVDAIHDRAIRPLLLVARGLVYGIVVAAMATVIAVALSIGLVRLLNVYVFGGRVWASDAVLGLVLCAVGAFAWFKRRPPVEES